MLKVLAGSHHRVAQRITGMTAKRGADGEWDYPSVVEAMEAAGLHPIGVCIKRRKATISDRVAYTTLSIRPTRVCTKETTMNGI